MDYVLVTGSLKSFQSATLRIFICYSGKDRAYKKALLNLIADVNQIHSLEHPNEIAFWSDEDINAGELWRPAIEQAIKSSNATIALISKSWLECSFIQTKEIDLLEKKGNSEKYSIIPIVISDCEWKEHSFLKKWQAAVFQFDPNKGSISREVLRKLMNILATHLKEKLFEVKQKRNMEDTTTKRKTFHRNLIYSLFYLCIAVSTLSKSSFFSSFGTLFTEFPSIGTKEIMVNQLHNPLDDDVFSLHLLQAPNHWEGEVAIGGRPFFSSFQVNLSKNDNYVGQISGSESHVILTLENSRIRVYDKQAIELRHENIEILSKSELSFIRMRFGFLFSLVTIAITFFLHACRFLFKIRLNLY